MSNIMKDRRTLLLARLNDLKPAKEHFMHDMAKRNTHLLRTIRAPKKRESAQSEELEIEAEEQKKPKKRGISDEKWFKRMEDFYEAMTGEPFNDEK